MMDSILTQYEVRKSNWQKTAFIEYLQGRLSKAGYYPETEIKEEDCADDYDIAFGGITIVAYQLDIS